MKTKLISYLILISLIFSACRSRKEVTVSDKILGKWKIASLDTGEEVEEGSKDEYNKLMEQMINNAWFIFKSDKTFSMSLYGQEMKGSWFYDTILNRLETNPEGKKDTEYFLVEIVDSKTMILKTIDTEGSIIMKLEKE